MLVFLKTLEFRQMRRHSRIRKSLTIEAVIPHRKRKEMVSHNATDVQIVMGDVSNFDREKVCVSCFAWELKSEVFNPCSVGRKPTHNQVIMLNMSVSNLILK